MLTVGTPGIARKCLLKLKPGFGKRTGRQTGSKQTPELIPCLALYEPSEMKHGATTRTTKWIQMRQKVPKSAGSEVSLYM